MATKASPPVPPKPTGPGKSLPKSEERLADRDRELEKPKPAGEGEEKQEPKKEGQEREAEKKEGEEEEEKEKGEGEDEEEEEEDEDEEEEEEEEETTEVVGKGLLNLTTVWGVLFFIIFVLIDGTGIALVFFALDDFWILDIIGLIFYIVWQMIYSNFYGAGGEMAAAEQAKQRLQSRITKKAESAVTEQTKTRIAKKSTSKLVKLFTGKWTKIFVPLGTEIVPYLGQIVPTWTISFLVQIINS